LSASDHLALANKEEHVAGLEGPDQLLQILLMIILVQAKVISDLMQRG